MKTLTLFALLFGLTVQAQDELMKKPAHGGQVVKKQGLAYEVVRKPKEILVYPPKEDAPVPSRITLRFKNKSGVADLVHIQLMPPKEPGTSIYSGTIPASVYIAGGLTFDLDFGPAPHATPTPRK